MTSDERRALAFVALLLALAAGARLVRRDPPVEWAGEAVDTDSLEALARARKEEADRRSRPLAPGERIDPNTASEEELDRLPGVGPALARRIVEARETGGPFRSVDDLSRVRGIGPTALRRLAPHLEIAAGAGGQGGGGWSGGAAKSVAPGPGVTPTLRPVDTPAPGGAGSRAKTASGRPAAGERTRSGAGGAGGAARARGGAGATARAPLDLNRATAAELETLPGIGPALAARIVAYRDSVGGFRDVGELLRVRGIGEATLVRLRPHLRVVP